MLEDILGSLLLLVPGAIMLLIGGKMVKTCFDSYKWPSIWGEIVRSEIIKERLKGRNTGNKIVYRPMVSYSYRLNSKEYTGKNEYPMQQPKNFVNKADAEKYLKDWPLSSSIRVFYKPSEPEFSCLKPGLSRMAIMLFGIGVTFTFLAIVGIALTIQRHFL